VLVAGIGALWTGGKRRAALALALVAVGGAMLGLLTSNDPSRSMVLLVPVVPLGWAFARGVRGWLRWHVPSLLAAAALLLPAQHVVSDFSQPIFSLRHEVGLLRDPPPALAGATYLQNAARAMGHGDLVTASRLAGIAVRLDPGSAAAHNVLGVVLARQGRSGEAERELEEAARIDPADGSYRANLERVRGQAHPR
jgi:tetratricopeptide (TPR) repeat protein